jgi:hypothetical protein
MARQHAGTPARRHAGTLAALLPTYLPAYLHPSCRAQSASAMHSMPGLDTSLSQRVSSPRSMTRILCARRFQLAWPLCPFHPGLLADRAALKLPRITSPSVRPSCSSRYPAPCSLHQRPHVCHQHTALTAHSPRPTARCCHGLASPGLSRLASCLLPREPTLTPPIHCHAQTRTRRTRTQTSSPSRQCTEASLNLRQLPTPGCPACQPPEPICNVSAPTAVTHM